MFQKYGFTSLLLIISAVFIAGCGATIHLKEGEYLLQKEPVFKSANIREQDTGRMKNPLALLGKMTEFAFTDVKKSSVDDELLLESIQTHPNRQVLVFKAFLNMYNLGITLRDYELLPEMAYRWVRPQGRLLDTIQYALINVVGEPPVLIDSAKLDSDIGNLRSVYFANGFFHPRITYAVKYGNGTLSAKKANVTFFIQENTAYVIDTILYKVRDPMIRQYLSEAEKQTLILRGDRYNENTMTAERDRITDFLRTRGYLKFNSSMIRFAVDTTYGLKLGDQNSVNSPIRRCALSVEIMDAPIMYDIQTVHMYMQPAEVNPYELSITVRGPELNDTIRDELNISRSQLNDTLKMTWHITNRVLEKVNLNLLGQYVYLREGERFSLFNARETQRKLQNFGVFRFSNIRYELYDSIRKMDVIIESQLSKKYQLKTGIEAFSENNKVLQSNLPGAGTYINFRNNNLFKGGEKMDISAKYSVSVYRPEQVYKTFSTFGLNANLNVPRFLFPWSGQFNMIRLNPITTFGATLNAETRAEFSRSTLGLSITYSWSLKRDAVYPKVAFSPLIVNLIISDITQSFQNRIDNITPASLRVFVQRDYTSRFSTKSSLKVTWADYMTRRDKITQFFQPVLEMGGNLPYAIDRYFGNDTSYKDGFLGSLNNITYGQFMKGSLEYKVFVPITRKLEFVARTFAGAATPWNFTTQVPFEFRFFSGGASSMRGWQSFTLGPGTYNSAGISGGTGVNSLVAVGGECIFETNAELRFDLYDFIEGAAFIEAGNVWFLNSSSFDSDRGKLTAENMVLGLDAGLGLRMDFTVFIFRFDVGQQVYAPDIRKFIVNRFPRDIGGNRISYNLGIGYPF